MVIVEDEPGQRELTTAVLEHAGYVVSAATNGAEAIDLVTAVRPDVVLLDLGLPDVDGSHLCRVLRHHHECPIIIVTADDDEERIVELLDRGADDYIVKPISSQVLLARLRVALRHRTKVASLLDEQVIRTGDVWIDTSGRAVRIGDDEVDLLPRQFDLLAAFVRNPGRLMTYATLVRVAWDSELHGDNHLASLRTAVSRLRQQLGTGPLRPQIETERHVGYRLVAVES